jgi:hypothetical protein
MMGGALDWALLKGLNSGLWQQGEWGAQALDKLRELRDGGGRVWKLERLELAS